MPNVVAEDENAVGGKSIDFSNWNALKIESTNIYLMFYIDNYFIRIFFFFPLSERILIIVYRG